MKTYFRLILIFATIFLASLTTALSCDKEDGTNQSVTNEGNITNVTNKTNVINVVNETNFTNNTHKTNVDKNTTITKNTEIVSEAVEGGRPTPRIQAAEGLENFVITVNDTYAKLEGGAIYINATALANNLARAIADPFDNRRGAGKVANLVDNGASGAVNVPRIFTISIKDVGKPSGIASGGIMLLKPDTDTATRDTLEYPAETTGYPAALNTAGPVVADIYRTFNNSLFSPSFYVWNTFSFGTTTFGLAEGVFYCRADLSAWSYFTTDDPLTGGQTMECRLASVNRGVFPGNAEIDEAWVDDATTTKTLKLRLFGIDTGAKEISKLVVENNNPLFANRIAFSKHISNTDMKKIMDANTYYESKLTIKIVKEEDF